MQAISEADKVTVGLVASTVITVCESTFLLLLAADAAAKQIIKNRKSKKSNSHNIKEKTTPAEDPIPNYKVTASVTETSTSTACIHSTDLESETTTQPPSIPSACPQNIKEDLHYPVPNCVNHHSFDSATTLVAGSDDDDDGGEVFHKVTTTPKPSSKPAQDEADTVLPAPGSRTKARISSLRRRTHAVTDWIPATTAKRAPAAPYRPTPITWPSLRRQGRVGWIP